MYRTLIFLLLITTSIQCKPPPDESRVVICGCARTIEEHLPRVFSMGIEPLASLFQDYRIVIFENDSKDRTLDYLQALEKADPKITILQEQKLKRKIKRRTVRLAYARNRCMEYIHKQFSDFDYVIIMDLDDHPVKDKPLDKERVLQMFESREKWDVLSIGQRYYDIWALRSAHFPHNCFNIEHPYSYIKYAKDKLHKKLKKMTPTDLIEVDSAFNGLAIYYLPKTKECLYNGNNEEPIYRTKSDCEHVAFHRDMREKHDAKLFISPIKIF